MAHCVVEYGGTSYGSVYLYDAAPQIQNTTIRYSKNAGIFAIGSGTNTATVTCNTFASNKIGISWRVSPPPQMHHNNFLRNTDYGLYYTGSETLDAENNWWGDAAGPDQAGDALYGNVDADPWATVINQCSTDSQNYPPHQPSSPTPTNGAVNVPVGSGVTLGWTGGDPNTADMISYDLYWGTDADSLQMETSNLTSPTYTQTNLDQGITYFWKVIARDNHGAETAGPVWRLTTNLLLPDLTLNGLTIDPPGHLQAGQSVTFTAIVQNIGTRALQDSFVIDFQVDGSSIGTVSAGDAMEPGGIINVSQSWTYNDGNPAIQVIADSQSHITEADETNNTYTVALSEVADNAAPALTGTSPSSGAILYEIQQITVTLSDSQSAVDDAAVTAGFSVVDGNQQPVGGTIVEDNDTFTFTPGSLPLDIGSYQVSLTAADIHGNAQVYTFGFSIVDQPPEPTVVGGTISTDTTWTLEGSPYLVTSNITISGTDGADGITTLTIAPGVEVRFSQSRQMAVGGYSGNPGALKAIGTAQAPIVFTSDASTPAKGDWNNIQCLNTSDDGATVLEFCRVQYAGSGNLGAVYIYQSSPTLKNTTIENSSSYGFSISNGSPAIEACRLSGNGNYDFYYTGTVGGSVTGSTINNGISLLANGSVTFSGNTVNQNNSFPIKAYADSVGSIVSANTISHVDEASYLQVNSGTISHDASWTAAIPYNITGDLSIQGTDGDDGVTTLTLAAGARLKFNSNADLKVGNYSGASGALVSRGTSDHPILFTSNQAAPAPGDWNNIQLLATTEDTTTILEYSIVEYAGAGNQGAVYIYQSSPTLKNTTIENSSSHGFSISNGSPAIEACRLSGNGNYDFYYSGTVGGSVTGSTVNNGISLLANGSVTFTGNTVNQNNSFPLKAYADSVGSIVSANTISHVDEASYLQVNSGTISHDASWTAAIPYNITGDLSIQGTDGDDGVTTLTLAAGARLKFNSNADLKVGNYSGASGALVSRGTSDHPILFTSNQAAPAPGDWNNIQLLATTEDTTTILEYCIVEYAGAGNQGAVYLYNSKPAIQYCIFRNNQDKGLYISGTGCNDAQIRYNTFSGNAYGVYVTGNAQPVIEFNNFDGNSEYGLYNASSGTTVTANHNWWGDAQGPGPGGDGVYGNVTTAAWLSDAYDITSAANHIPSALDDTAVTDEDTPVTIPVLANDSDLDGDPLTLTGFTQASNGHVQDNGDGSLRYTPQTNFNGEDSFSYTITDGNASITANVAVTVHPVNDSPSVDAGPDQNVLLGSIVYLSAGESSDPDGDTLTFNWSFVSRPENSSAAFSLPASATPRFTADAEGVFEATVSVHDGTDTVTDSVLITVAGPPTVSLTASPQVVTHGETATLSWVSDNADTVTLDQNIGEVDLNGSLVVSPELTTTYTITAQGSGLTATAAVTVGVGAQPVAVINTIAGTGVDGYSGDEGPAVSARLNAPYDLVVDEAGNIYIADTDNSRIRKVDTSGIITTVANDQDGFDGPVGIALGRNGALYIADRPFANRFTIQTIYEMQSDGAITTLADHTILGNGASAMAADGNGNLYFACTSRDQVFRIDADANVILVAGSGDSGFSGDGGPATNARLNDPSGIAFDPAGRMYIADLGNARIRKVDTSGIISTIAGNGTAGFGGDFGPATGALLSEPTKMAVDIYGNLFFVDSGNHRIRKVDTSGMITTVAGNEENQLIDQNGDGGLPDNTFLAQPQAVAIDSHGDLYIAEARSSRVRKVASPASFGVLITAPGEGFAVLADSVLISGNTTPGAEVFVNGVQADVNGHWFEVPVSLIEGRNHIIAEARSNGETIGYDALDLYSISQLHGIIDTVAGGGELDVAQSEGASALDADIQPTRIAMDDGGNIYFTERLQHRIRKMDSGGMITTVAGTGDAYFSGDGGPAVQARLNEPEGISLDTEGNIYFADTQNYRIRKIDTDGIITTVAGTGDLEENGCCGPALERNIGPLDVAVGDQGTLYIADNYHYRVLEVDADGICSHLTGQVEWYGRDVVTQGEFIFTHGLNFGRDGKLYIADPGKQVIWRMDNALRTQVAGVHCLECALYDGYVYDGFNGESGPATEIMLHDPQDAAVDAGGTLFIADTTNHRIRRVTPDGTLTTVAGRTPRCAYYMASSCPYDQYSGDGGPATRAQINYPQDVAVDSSGTVYFPEASGRIRRIRPAATIELTGLVFDQAAELPIANAMVSARASAVVYTTVTDTEGRYRFEDIQTVPGPVSVTVQAAGYVDGLNQSTIPDPPQSVTMDIGLVPVPELTAAIDPPDDAAQVDTSPVTITGSLSHAAMVKVNGVPARVTGTRFSATVPLDQGANTIRVTAQDVYGQTATAQRTLTLAYDTPPAADIFSSADQIVIGETVTLSWETDNAATVRIDPDIGPVTPSGALVLMPGQTTTYTLSATNSAGTTTAELTLAVVPPEPTVDLKASPNYLDQGQTTTLSWTHTHADTLTIEPGIGEVPLNASVMVAVHETTTYTITATGPGGTATDTVVVHVYPPPQVSFFTVDPDTINSGDTASLRWAVSQALTVSIDNGIGEVATYDSLQISPTETTTYTLTATNHGTTTATVTVTVVSPPEIEFTADDLNIHEDGSATLSWHVADADTVTIDNLVGEQDVSGSISVHPAATTTYTLTASGVGGSAQAAVTITVHPVPQVSIGAEPQNINPGGQSLLTWSVTGADTCTLTPDLGTVALSGEQSVSPARTTAYTLTAANAGGAVMERVIVTVADEPTAALTADRIVIDSGESVTLTWQTGNAEQCALAPDIGTVALNGQLDVTPAAATRYTLSAGGPGGEAVAAIRIYVRGQDGYGDPTPSEQAHIEAINRARMNPASEADRLDIDLNEGLADGTLDGSPVQPLACSALLLEAARLHSHDMLVNQYVAHDARDGRTTGDRLEAVGFAYSTFGENLAFMGQNSPLDETAAILAMHDNLFIDNGVDGRGHRLNILDPAVKEVGPGISLGGFSSFANAALLTCDFAVSSRESRAFLLGVVYDDHNGDGRYTAGEGLGEAQIYVEETGDTTFTASAGGYRIPLSPGDYTVQANLADGRRFSQSVTVADLNVKADFALAPLPAIAFSADADAFVPGDDITLQWSVSDAETVSISPGIGDVGLNGTFQVSPTETTTYTLTATGPGGTATQNLVLSLRKPLVEFQADPAGIADGQSATLSWNVTGAQTVTIDQGIGTVDAAGTLQVTPGASTTYTLTAEGAGGTTGSSVTVWLDTTPPGVTAISPTNNSVIETQNTTVTIVVALQDDVSGLCASRLLDSEGQDVSHLLSVGDGEVFWDAPVDSDGVVQYTLVLEDCAGNVAEVPVGFSTLSVPEDTDLGAGHPQDQVGGAIRITNGNVLAAASHLSLVSPNQLGLGFEAYYNSRSTRPGDLGHGWTHTYSINLSTGVTVNGRSLIRIEDADGRAAYFSAASPYAAQFNEKSRLGYTGGQYVWQRTDGTRAAFRSDGSLDWLQDPAGNRLVLGYDGDGNLATVTDTAGGRTLTFVHDGHVLNSIRGPVTDGVTDGVWVVFGHDAYQNLESVAYADDSGEYYYYTDPYDPHNLTRIENNIGHLKAQWHYDSRDRAVESRLPDDTGVVVDYLAADQVVVTDAYHIPRTYSLTTIGGRVKVIALQGPAVAPYSPEPAVRWQYDDLLNLEEMEFAGGTADSPMNTIHRFEDYDAQGNPGTVISAWNTPEERIVTFTYHPEMSAVLTRTETSVMDDQQAKEVIYDYDDDGNDIPNESPTGLVHRVIDKGVTRSAGGAPETYVYVTSFEYNARGQVISSDGPLEGTEDVVGYSYDDVTGDLTAITRPLVGSTGYSEHDDAGRPGVVTDVNGIDSTLIYDGRGRVTRITNLANGGQSIYTYENGLLSQTVDADGITRTFTYEPEYGRLDTVTDHQGNTVVYDYDDKGNRTGEVRYAAGSGAATGQTAWSFDHPDQPGLLYRTYTPAPGDTGREVYTQYQYDLAGNPDRVTDPQGRQTTYVYDSLNRISEMVQPGNGVTTLAYDRHGNLNTVTDALGNPTIYAYDDMSRLVAETSPDTGTTTYAYNAAGSLVFTSDSRGVDVNYTPDVLGRTRQIDSPAYNSLPAYSVTYEYDNGPGGMGRLTGMNDASGSTAWDYADFDDLGIVSKTSAINGTAYTVTQTRTPGGRITRLAYPSGRIVDYNRTRCTCAISGVTTTFNNNTVTLLADLEYRPFGIAKTMDIGGLGTANVDNRHDSAGLLAKANPGTPHERTYTYDALGNPTAIAFTTNPLRNQNFGYDTLGRLTSAMGPFGFAGYDYDQAGNRLSRTENGFADAYAYVDGTNRLDSITPTGGTTTDYAYDNHGNTIQAGGRTFDYNQNNQLAAFSDDTAAAEYVYNGLGQRVIKTVNGESTHFIYDMDSRLIAETPAGSNFTQGLEYLYRGKNLLAQADPATEAVSYYHTNYLGAVHQLTNAGGTILWEATYLPFGEAVVAAGSTVTNNWRLPGQYFDGESGLYYNYHRYYDPGIGRYLTPDPIGLEGGINLYAYAKNNPANGIDPYGLLFGFNAGEGYGESAAMYYANITIDPCASKAAKIGAWAGGLFASLWTPDTSDNTFWTLATAYFIGKVKTKLFDVDDPSEQTFDEQMTPEERARYERYWRQDYKDVYEGEPNTRERKYTTPGTRSITDQKISSNGEVYERQTIYDQYGRKIGNNDFSSHGRPLEHPNPHHHPNPPTKPEMHGPVTPGFHPETPKY